MDLDLHDDAFSDPDLDDVPINMLNELEKQAIQASQRPPIIHAQQRHQAPSSDYGLDEEEEEVINLDDPQNRNHGFGTLVESHLHDEASEREQWRRNRYSGTASRPSFQHGRVEQSGARHLGGTAAHHRHDEAARQNGFDIEEPNGVLGDFGALQARVEEVRYPLRRPELHAYIC